MFGSILVDKIVKSLAVDTQVTEAHITRLGIQVLSPTENRSLWPTWDGR
jgi:hypothetical protein